ncbi:MAG: flagellar basal body-associated FliL family protein [Defluviitaleaceae bacterium]|nr:flagellar basal body-associated FliL family protein [Defluviitaleaceae bacterium]
MNEDQNVEAVVAAPSGNKKMMFLIVGLLVLLIGVVVAVAIYIVSVIGQTEAPVVIIDQVIPAATVEDTEFVSIGHPINTNLLTGADGRNMAITLNFNIGINYGQDGGPELVDIMSSAEPVVRNTALSVVRDMTAVEVNSRDGATMIASEIQRRLQEEFQTNLITGVFIIDIFTAPSG